MRQVFLRIWKDWEIESKTLRQELLSGSYIPEGNEGVILNGKRGIYRVGVRDKWVQQAVYEVLGELLHVEDKSERKRRHSVRHIACSVSQCNASQNAYIYETDIRRFFPSIAKDIVIEKIISRLEEDSLRALILHLISTTVHSFCGNAGAPEFNHFWHPDEGIPQGSILSPLFADVYLREFDAWSDDKDWQMFRYVDDLVVFCETLEQAEAASVEIPEELSKLGLETHAFDPLGGKKAKAAIRTPAQDFKFLGIQFRGGRMRPGEESIKKLNRAVEVICSESNDLTTMLIRVNRLIEGWHSAYSFCDLGMDFRTRRDRHIAYTVGHKVCELGFLKKPHAIYNPGVVQRLGLLQLASLKKQIISYEDTKEDDKALSITDLIDGEDLFSPSQVNPKSYTDIRKGFDPISY